MNNLILTCMIQGICLAYLIGAAPERTLLPAAGLAEGITDNPDLAAQFEAFAASANFHSGEKGGMDTTVMAVHDYYRKCLSEGRYIVVRYGEPHPLRIAGNREMNRELTIQDLVIGFSEELLPSDIFAVTEKSEVLQLAKYRGDLAVQLQKRLSGEPDDGAIEVEPPKPASPARDMSSSLSISPADFQVVTLHGVFGTYGIPRVGDVLRFDPNSILNEMPQNLDLEAADGRSGPSYLNIPEFRLERVKYDKGQVVGYSFFCRQGARGALNDLLRFDLLMNWGKMFVVYESQGIVLGVIVLEKVPR